MGIWSNNLNCKKWVDRLSPFGVKMVLEVNPATYCEIPISWALHFTGVADTIDSDYWPPLVRPHLLHISSNEVFFLISLRPGFIFHIKFDS